MATASALRQGVYDAVYEKKSEPSYISADRSICKQLDELERISSAERDKHLGREYFRDIKEFYQLNDEHRNWPSYRPSVRIPQLQTLVLNEATDITDASIKVYITNEGKRDDAREKYYQANWRQGCYNNRILESVIWAMLTNLGFLQVGFSPNARRGKGMTWLECRDPETVLPDPFCKSDSDWSWVQYYDWMYIDDVRRQWPEQGWRVQGKSYAGTADPYGTVDSQMEYPEASPLSQQGETKSSKIFRDNRVKVRHTYLFDNTRQKVEEYAGMKAISKMLVHPRFEYKYPDGRWLTDCNNVVLADGNNWVPQLPDDERGTFPLIRVAAMPTISNFWGPPPIKLSRSLQELSERLYTQTFENVVRLNNGVIIIKANTGLDPNAIGWMPGEVLVINQGSDPPTVIQPQALPQHMITLPASLLSLQKELQGFSEARQGQNGGGNVSPDLFDATLWQSHYQTRLRGRLLAESLQRLAQIVFYTDARYKNVADRVAAPERGELKQTEWTPIDSESMDKYDAHLDPGSLRVISAGALRSVVSALAKAKMVPTKYVLETLDLPAADELAEENMRELELAALGKLKRPR
jgi:hypothetical protein